MIKLQPAEWEEIFNKIKIEYANTPSVYMIRGTMRRVLGFTVREHQRWTPAVPAISESVDIIVRNMGYMSLEICLDFYDDTQETFFRLKYI
jgi:hypothetical protein